MQNNPIKILLADDDATIRKLFGKRLSMMGHEIVGEAVNGQEAVDLFKKLRPDILLLDINMPVKNGVVALREIMDEFHDACVIMFTSFQDMELVEDCITAGAVNYISKDGHDGKIKEVIESAWRDFNKGNQK